MYKLYNKNGIVVATFWRYADMTKYFRHRRLLEKQKNLKNENLKKLKGGNWWEDI